MSQTLKPLPGLWYMASPYSHTEQAVMASRFEAAAEAAAELMRAGWILFSPITHTHPIAQYDLPKGWEYWQKYDEVMISKCDGLIVLQLPGWDTSRGVQAEILIAARLGLPAIFWEGPCKYGPMPPPLPGKMREVEE